MQQRSTNCPGLAPSDLAGRLFETRRLSRELAGPLSPEDMTVQAMEDALRLYSADEVIISTHPPGRSNWLEHDVVSRAQERFEVPVTHVVVDLELEQADAGARSTT